MRSYLFAIHVKSASERELRLVDLSRNTIRDSRRLNTADIETFIADVERAYTHSAIDDAALVSLGRRLYAWLDGRSHRWLQGLPQDRDGVVLHIDCLSLCSFDASDRPCWSDAYESIVNRVRSLGIAVCAALGNAGPGTHGSPGNYATVLGIGALTRDGSPWERSSSGSVPSISGTFKPDLWAPGAGVRSALPDKNYGPKSGTSMAAPIVAGLGALVLQQKGSTADLHGELLARAKDGPGLPHGSPLRAAHFGSGTPPVVS